MTTLYRRVDALSKTDATIPGILHINSPEPMWLVPVEVEAEHIQDSTRRRIKTVYVTPWTTDDRHSGAS